ncbi:hypothetical protein GCM10029992_01790 [Glycomyces albus]
MILLSAACSRSSPEWTNPPGSASFLERRGVADDQQRLERIVADGENDQIGGDIGQYPRLEWRRGSLIRRVNAVELSRQGD